ncbi:MAG: hypothetical protein F4X02_12585 [Chloroflexi bacterium]|nr:hypothetical protein [Chloroflexota bacterium]
MATSLPPGFCAVCHARDGTVKAPRSASIEPGGSHWLYVMRCERCRSVDSRPLCKLEDLPKSLEALRQPVAARRASGYPD